jgi:hypothetical protein
VQEIQLESRPMRYGGRRYYFLCPKHGRRCEVLPMVGGVFASRQAGRLTYQSQSADQIDRMRDRAHKLEKRLWPDKGKPRPRGRNRERLFEAWSQADSAFENMFAATIMRRWVSIRTQIWVIRQVVVARMGFSLKPAKGPTNGARAARSSSNTSQMVRSLNCGCRVRWA